MTDEPLPFTAEWLALYHKRKGKGFRLRFESRPHWATLPSRQEKANRLQQQEHTCCWCGHYLSMGAATWEHIIPRAHGGTDDFENLALAHYPCNDKRGTKLEREPHPSRKFDFIRERLAKFKSGGADVKHVVMFSGGIGSWAAAKRVAARHGTADLTLLFTDTRMEDEDLYRFLDEAAANVGGTLVRLTEGRTPWQVFFDKRFLGNSRVDPCSKVLKRDMADRWLDENCTPEDTRIYVGIDWSEQHRIERLAERRKPWVYEAPMCDAPFLTKPDMLTWLKREGIQPPRLYELGFAHNNCGGFCIKAGLGHFANLLRTMPERYAYHEAKEEELRRFLGRDDITVVRDWATRPPKNITLRQLRERIQAGTQVDLFDQGGCGCFVEEGA